MASKKRTRNKRPPDLGPKLKALRLENRLTLDQLAERSGLSKSMLSQIERGQTNATFATLWNVTSALHIDLSDLIGPGKSDESGPLEHVAAHLTPAMKSADGLCTLRILSPAKLAGITEWYEIEVLAKGRLESAPHGKGCTEHLTCLSGQLVATSNGESTARLKVGDTVRYRADVQHAIENPTGRTARALLILTF